MAEKIMREGLTQIQKALGEAVFQRAILQGAGWDQEVVEQELKQLGFLPGEPRSAALQAR